MSGKYLIIATAITTALLLSTGAYAGGGMGGGMGGGQGMMGGQGHGMMGSGGNGMMGAAPNYSNPWTTPQSRRSPADQDKQIEREKLRAEIREKRQELSALYRSDKPDRSLIDQKIAELNALETDHDRSISGAE
jgi:Spy/CpxP family protein refolding chaperone